MSTTRLSFLPDHNPKVYNAVWDLVLLTEQDQLTTYINVVRMLRRAAEQTNGGKAIQTVVGDIGQLYIDAACVWPRYEKVVRRLEKETGAKVSGWGIYCYGFLLLPLASCCF
jgi:hypothetical protein